MTKIIRLSTPWNHDFLSRTPHNSGIFGEFSFSVSCRECDYWVVWGGLKATEEVYCPPANVIYVTDETHSERHFNQEFLSQFPVVVACRDDLKHKQIIKSHDLGIWHFHRSYDEVISLDIAKSKTMSIVSSSLKKLPGHRLRFEFIESLRHTLGEKIDYYGRGINEIHDKFDGIGDYKYSIAIENSNIEGYFTEKLFECFLTHTLPVYYGCPNIGNYFDERSLVKIDIKNVSRSRIIIDELFNSDIYEERLPYIIEAKRLFLEKYLFFPAIVNIINQNWKSKSMEKKAKVRLFPEAFFGGSLPPIMKYTLERIGRLVNGHQND